MGFYKTEFGFHNQLNSPSMICDDDINAIFSQVYVSEQNASDEYSIEQNGLVYLVNIILGKLRDVEFYLGCNDIKSDEWFR